MKTIKQASDDYIYNLWFIPSLDCTLGQVYEFMAYELFNSGYGEKQDTPAVRRRIKCILHQKRRIPRNPTLEDYHRSRTLPAKLADDLN